MCDGATPGRMACCNAVQGKALPYCRVQPQLNEVASACSANPDCKAFTITSSSGGYLKTSAGPLTYTEGTVAYVKV
jgi:hypothetical protein